MTDTTKTSKILTQTTIKPADCDDIGDELYPIAELTLDDNGDGEVRISYGFESVELFVDDLDDLVAILHEAQRVRDALNSSGLTPGVSK